MLQQVSEDVYGLLEKYPHARGTFRDHAIAFKLLYDRWHRLWAEYEVGRGKSAPPCPAKWQIEDKLCCYYVTAAVIHDIETEATANKPLVRDILGQTGALVAEQKQENDPATPFRHIRAMIETNDPLYRTGKLKNLTCWIELDLRRQTDIPETDIRV